MSRQHQRCRLRHGARPITHGTATPRPPARRVKESGQYVCASSSWRAQTDGLRLRRALAAGRVVAKVADFGMARRLAQSDAHVSGVRQGTPFFMAPEVQRDHRLLPASDVYSFGVIMWELLRGTAVFVSRCASRRRRPCRRTPPCIVNFWVLLPCISRPAAIARYLNASRWKLASKSVPARWSSPFSPPRPATC